jgi:hypothetical protein
MWTTLSRLPWLMVILLVAAAFAITAAGCSTAPCADFLDFFVPGHISGDGKVIEGGVCIPQGGPAGGVLGAPPATAGGLPTAPGPGPIGVPAQPPPAPLSQTPMRPTAW